MLAYVLLCAVIWIGTYLCMVMSGEPIEVKPIRSIDDLFE